MKISLFLCNCS